MRAARTAAVAGGGGEQATVTFDDGTIIAANTFDSGWRRDGYAAITYTALVDGDMKYSWDLAFEKTTFGYAGGFTLSVCLACTPFLQVILDNFASTTGSIHSGSGSMALAEGQTYQFFVREWTSSDGFQSAKSFAATGTIALEFPGAAPVPLPATAPLMAAALAALGLSGRGARGVTSRR